MNRLIEEEEEEGEEQEQEEVADRNDKDKKFNQEIRTTNKLMYI